MTANTPRARMSETRRQHIFSENCTAHNIAPCCICEKPVHRHNDRWIVEHRRALALLGPDTNTNCGPAHYACGQVKTHQQDLPMVRKAKRQQEAAEVVRDRPAKLSGLPIRPFNVPAGAVYDWKQRRHIKQENT